MQSGKEQPIILASSSPRRRELLSAMRVAFEVMTSAIDESSQAGETPLALAYRLSQAKAESAASAYIDAIIVAADTVVALDNDILGKPRNRAEAMGMLVRLRQRQHLVYTGLTVIDLSGGRRCTQVAITPVLMRAYSDEEIRHYVASGDPLDKAGAYAIQYADFNPVARFEGCYTNVMGLPLCHLYRLLCDWHIAVPRHSLEACPLAIKEGCPWATEILSVDSIPCMPAGNGAPQSA